MVSRHEIGSATQKSLGMGGLVSIKPPVPHDNCVGDSISHLLVGAFSVIVKTDCETDGLLYTALVVTLWGRQHKAQSSFQNPS